MAGTDNLLFKIEAVLVGGQPLAIEDGSGTLSGATGFRNEVALSGAGDDFEKRVRVPRVFKAKIQWGAQETPEKYAGMTGVQISCRDLRSGRTALLNNCSCAEVGDIGAGGPVDVTFNVLSPIQWI